MSQEYFAPGGGDSSSSRPPHNSSPSSSNSQVRHAYERPNYMTVGSGSAPEHAHRLAELLDNDSGYGGSIAGGSSVADGWNPSLMDDRPSPMFSPQGALGSRIPNESDRRTMASHVHQLYYNQNRTSLARAITRTLEILKQLQEVNKEWPAQYPSVQPPAIPGTAMDPRPGLHHTISHLDGPGDRTIQSRPTTLRRAETVAESKEVAESSTGGAQKPTPEPRLVTPKLARDFSVLKIDLKMDGLPQTEIIHSLRKDSKALAQLLDGQINKSVRHLLALRERIEDTSSKVLITGDLNAGKSTFCNALLRRKILPEDEQPCTSIFCEVLDVRDNGGIEEVHAIPVGQTYDRNDERTYEVFPLQKLESIVVNNEVWSQCKIYVKDTRSVDESLLNNGVLDIALIDAPGLNNDSLKTTAVFARQEEIDVVVFVASAANHLTLSAREFIYDAAREKAFIFMVVNGFDMIRNKKRCQEQILKQVAHLSPATHKESKELIHFVSSNAIPVSSVAGGSSSGGGDPDSAAAGGVPRANSGGDPDSDPGDDEDGEDEATEERPADKGKGKEKAKEARQDFEQLEASLRRFVLEKRARSKLAPAKTYLMNVLDDMQSLAVHNRDVAEAELSRVTEELKSLLPQIDEAKKSRNETTEGVDLSIEDASADVYEYARSTLDATISDVSQRDLGVHYPGFWDAYSYAEDIITAMVKEVSEAVGLCEDYAREKTTQGVNVVKSVGLLHLGDAYTELAFQPSRMFKRKKDIFARQVDVTITPWDFFDITHLWERQEKVAGTGMAVTIAGVLGGRLVGGVGWVDGALGAARIVGSNNLQRLVVPGVILTVVLGVSYAIASIPQSLPRRLSNKLAAELGKVDFTHQNAQRISTEVRRALKIPADGLRLGLQKNFEQLQTKREETNKVKHESEIARKYFGNLVRDSNDVKGSVERVDLEGPAPGIGAAFE